MKTVALRNASAADTLSRALLLRNHAGRRLGSVVRKRKTTRHPSVQGRWHAPDMITGDGGLAARVRLRFLEPGDTAGR